jgi:hypothetical protein
MEKINDTRRGMNYYHLDAAIASIHGQVVKKDLERSLFVVSFELGMNNEGYWTYNHTSIRFEDFVDCKVLFPQFDFEFLFDHSQGHAKKLMGGLDAYSMKRGYGGAQPMMRKSKIKEHYGYLGSNARILDVGDTQSFVFTSDNNGPFWMTPQQRELNRNDRLLPPAPRNP